MGSMNENTNRLGPTTCSVLTMSGMTLGEPAEADGDGAGDGLHAAAATATSSDAMAAIDRRGGTSAWRRGMPEA